jgi:hypothetical protein
MISDLVNRGKRDDLWATLSSSVQARIERGTVRLHGGMFTGSGVILTAGVQNGEGRMVVATAAHNLKVYIDGLSGQARTDFWGGGPQPWSLQEMNTRKAAMIQSFRQNVSIYYDAADMIQPDPTVENGVATITAVKMGSFVYDACLLFAAFQTNRRPRCELIASWAEVDQAADLVRAQMQNGALPVGWSLLQSGFGRTNPGNELSVGTLNHKVAAFAHGGARPANMYDAILGSNEDVLVLTSSAAWTTLPGDSGGPLFAVNSVAQKVSVLGVTLGSEVFPNQLAEQQSGVTAQTPDGAVNNASTSLMRLYEGWAGGDRPVHPITPLCRKTWAELV